MQTLTINSETHKVLARAAEKARQEKPVVQKTAEYGVYTVLTHNRTKKYTVNCNSTTKEIKCNCKAFKPCYHIAAVAPLHSYIARQRQEAASQAAPALVQLPPVEVAHAQAEQAMSLVELEDLIEQALERNLDRDCPMCGLVQPDDDSSDCWCCGATVAPEDMDTGEYSEEMAARDRLDIFG